MADRDPVQDHAEEEEESDYGIARGRLIVSSVTLSMSITYGLMASDLALGTAVRPGPAVFPLAVATLTGLLAFGAVVEALRDLRRARHQEEEDLEDLEDLPPARRHSRGPGEREIFIRKTKVLAYTLGLIAFVWVTPRLGFLPATVALMWFLAGLVSGGWRSWRNALFALVAAFFIWMVFTQLFSIRLPSGLSPL